MKDIIAVWDENGEMVALIYPNDTTVATQTGYAVSFLTEEELEALDEEDEITEEEKMMFETAIYVDIAKNRRRKNL